MLYAFCIFSPNGERFQSFNSLYGSNRPYQIYCMSEQKGPCIKTRQSLCAKGKDNNKVQNVNAEMARSLGRSVLPSFSPGCPLCATLSDFPHVTPFMFWYFVSLILIANIIEWLPCAGHWAKPITYIFFWCLHVKLAFLSHFSDEEIEAQRHQLAWSTWLKVKEACAWAFAHLVSKSYALFIAQIPSTATLWNR